VELIIYTGEQWLGEPFPRPTREHITHIHAVNPKPIPHLTPPPKIQSPLRVQRPLPHLAQSTILTHPTILPPLRPATLCVSEVLARRRPQQHLHLHRPDISPNHRRHPHIGPRRAHSTRPLAQEIPLHETTAPASPQHPCWLWALRSLRSNSTNNPRTPGHPAHALPAGGEGCFRQSPVHGESE
jgi:hypothetical protein